jgi:hypothetical protein
MSPIEVIYDYFEDHVRLAAFVRERRPIAVGVLGFLVGGLSLFVAQALTQRLHLLSFSWASLIVVMCWKLLTGFVLASVTHLLLELQGRKGDVVSLFILFGLADLAWTLTVPVALITRLLLDSSLAVTIAFMAVGFLTLSLKARSLQDTHAITTGRAWFTLGVPYMVVVAGSILAASLLVARLIMAAFNASSN